MAEIRDYPSRVGDPASRRFETLSYLPQLDDDRLRAQVDYLLSQGWIAAIEHVEPERSGNDYWYMWKLPLFGEHDTERVLEELAACRNANPGHHVRLIGYDNRRQTQGMSLVAYRAV
jgi:ribulose-bisphosphate carboxylase small chain